MNNVLQRACKYRRASCYSERLQYLLVFFRSLAIAENTSGDNEAVASHPVGDVGIRDKILPAPVDKTLSICFPTSSSSSVDRPVSGLSGDACTVKAVGNGHVTNMAPNFRLRNGTTRGEGERALLTAEEDEKVSARKTDDRRRGHRRKQQPDQQQQQKHEGIQNWQIPNCSKTANSLHITPGDNLLQHHHHHHHHRQQQKLHHEQNTLPTNFSKTVSSVEKTRIADKCHHRHRQQHQQQQQQHEKEILQNLSLPPSNCSSTVTSTEKNRIENDQLLHPLDHLHHFLLQQQQQHEHRRQERQSKATSKNWDNSTAVTLNDLTPAVISDTLTRNRERTTRPGPPAPTSSLLRTPDHTRPLLHTSATVDGPWATATEAKTSSPVTRPEQNRQDGFVTCTLPRARFQSSGAINGEVRQRQPVLSPAASHLATSSHPLQTPSYQPVIGRPSWLGSHNPSTPTSKSKDAAFTKDRVQFFTHNELAAAVAMDNSCNSEQKTSATSKRNWFRRGLFK